MVWKERLRVFIIAKAWMILMASELDCWMSYSCGSLGVRLLDLEVWVAFLVMYDHSCG